MNDYLNVKELLTYDSNFYPYRQELALYNEFTISDTLTFFGQIHGLTSKETQARMDFLIDFLDLPQKYSLVRNLR